MSTDDGLEARYEVRKINDPTGKHDDCRYFVLDPQHDPIAHIALLTYAAEAKRNGYDALAHDLADWLLDTSAPAPLDAREGEEGVERCPKCRHMPHDGIGFCPNMASDNDCSCTYEGEEKS